MRLIEASRDRARLVAAELPDARVYHATGFDPDFLERERIADAQVAIFAMRDDMKNHFAATLAKVHGARFAVAIVHDSTSVEVFEQADRRHRQPAPDHGRGDRPLRPRPADAAGRDARGRPLRGPGHDEARQRVRGHALQGHADPGRLIGAIVRDGTAVFPAATTSSAPATAIIFTESRRVPEVEKAL